MAGAADEIVQRKIGPRALSFLGQPGGGGPLFNCPRLLPDAMKPFVLGEAGTPASAALLVHGTYILRVWSFPGLDPTFSVAVSQVRPAQLTPPLPNPLVIGQLMAPGEVFEFRVDDAAIDGAIMLFQCGGAPEVACDGVEFPIVTINRLLTVLPMSTTGNTASADELLPAASANGCPVPGPPP